MKTRNKKAACLMTALTHLIMTAACLLLCLTSCTREDADSLPDGGDYPPTGKRIPLRFGSAGTATYTISTADTRSGSTFDTGKNGFVSLPPVWMPQTRAAQTNTVEPYTSFIIYLFKKKTDGSYQFDSYCRCIWGLSGSGNYEVQNLNSDPLPYAYENTTLRMVAISNGEIVTNGVATTWMNEQITADKCVWGTGTPIDVDLNDGRNFMVYDSGDFKVREGQKINIKFEYLTSQILILIRDITAATIQEKGMPMKGQWRFGDVWITNTTEADPNTGQMINQKTSKCFYENTDNKFPGLQVYPYIRYSVIPAGGGGGPFIETTLTIQKVLNAQVTFYSNAPIENPGSIYPFVINDLQPYLK